MDADALRTVDGWVNVGTNPRYGTVTVVMDEAARKIELTPIAALKLAEHIIRHAWALLEAKPK